MENTRNALQNRAEEMKKRAQDTIEKAGDTAREAAATVADRARDVGRKAEEAAGTIASGMQSLAGSVRDKGPRGGMLGAASEKVADSLESGSRYLEKQGLSGVAGDLTNLVRDHPIPALLLGIGLGFLIARATRS